MDVRAKLALRSFLAIGASIGLGIGMLNFGNADRRTAVTAAALMWGVLQICVVIKTLEQRE